jgi:hypothetical protein
LVVAEFSAAASASDSAASSDDAVIFSLFLSSLSSSSLDGEMLAAAHSTMFIVEVCTVVALCYQEGIVSLLGW